MSITSNAEYARIQFATLAGLEQALLKYWNIESSPESAIVIQGDENWIFTDGGPARHSLHLHNLKTAQLHPQTTYRYQVGAVNVQSETQWSSIYEFHTPSRDDDFHFLVVSDMGINNAVAYKHLVKLAKEHTHDFVAMVGDQAYDMADQNGSKGDQYMNFVQELYARLPFLGTPGNHESLYNFTHYKNRFNILPFQESGFENPDMYSIDYKSLHLVSFSTEVLFEGSDAEIETALHWLDNDLRKANKHRQKRPWVVVFSHRPLYCSTQTISQDCTYRAAHVRNGVSDFDLRTFSPGIEKLLVERNVDLYISGHVHNYERTYPVTNGTVTARTYTDAPSLFHLVVGNAGQPERPDLFNSTGPYADWSAFRFDGYGYTDIKVTPTSLELIHRETKTDGTLGDIVDRVTVTKDVKKYN
ncbi:Metallo-dependent phosphatase-like protein [Radiomyces spectabilis]|uniref:Metallo-dependent phosphatase-like protein n=1 Tax=Radiomyces spectabilis TaxID=64574 RepID=UPI00222099D9|nr:Metallo-dependent phosphatase-like protein [Radiomyces spectabilis]KAI8373126.1 Metallo-dependent phosphatase-like protein [Radiomyces spectabilis]